MNMNMNRERHKVFQDQLRDFFSKKAFLIDRKTKMSF